jgi:acetate kinase
VHILVLNAGSSSLKASIVDAARRERLATAGVDWGSDATRMANRRATVEQVLRTLTDAGFEVDQLAAAGHRFVHGGTSFRRAVALDDKVLGELDRLTHLAPLHNAVALDTIRATREVLGDLLQVAVFDTGFHAGLPPAGYVYPLPWGWYEDWGIRRFGFHGLSVAWSVERAAAMLRRGSKELRLVVAHLGSGCSVTAVDGGQSVSTSMGLTPLEGLMMGTRAGSVDPGILLGVLRDGRVNLDELSATVDHGAGLLGLSGVSGDVREVSQAADDGNQRAALALDVFVRRAAEGIAAVATALPTLDALVFTGGIGEHAADLRARIVARLAIVGVAPIDATDGGRDQVLSEPSAPVAVLRIEAREDLVIGDEVAALIANRGD